MDDLELTWMIFLKAVWYFINFTLFCTGHSLINQKDRWNETIQSNRVITKVSHNFGKIWNAFFILKLIQTWQ